MSRPTRTSPPNCAPWPSGCSPWRSAWKPTPPPRRSSSPRSVPTEMPQSGGGGAVGRPAAGGGSRRYVTDAPLVWLILSTTAGFHKPRLRRLRPRQAPDAAACGSPRLRPRARAAAATPRAPKAPAPPAPDPGEQRRPQARRHPRVRRAGRGGLRGRGASLASSPRHARAAPAPESQHWLPNPRRRRLRHRRGGHGTGARQAEREDAPRCGGPDAAAPGPAPCGKARGATPSAPAPGNGRQPPNAIRRRLRHRPMLRPVAGPGGVHGARTAGTDGAPAFCGPDAPPRSGRRSRRDRAVAMRRPVGLPRPPSRPLAARRMRVLGAERERAAATPPPGERREASLPRAGNRRRVLHPAGRPARPRRCGRRTNGQRAAAPPPPPGPTRCAWRAGLGAGGAAGSW